MLLVDFWVLQCLLGTTNDVFVWLFISAVIQFITIAMVLLIATLLIIKFVTLVLVGIYSVAWSCLQAK